MNFITVGGWLNVLWNAHLSHIWSQELMTRPTKMSHGHCDNVHVTIVTHLLSTG